MTIRWRGGEKLNDVIIRNHVLHVAERMEQALGEERYALFEGCERDWERLPMPDGPSTVGIDGGFVRAQREKGHVEVITAKSILAFKRDDHGEERVPDAKCFAFVQTFDDKPQRRLFELLKSQGMQENQQYGERFRQRQTNSTAFVESTVNQVVSKRMVKRQQMQ